MEEIKKELIIGYDLCNDYSQISYFHHDQKEPKTLSTTAGEEKFQIPTVLLKKEGANKWYVGEEAIKRAQAKEGVLIADIVDKCIKEESIQIEGEVYTPVALLEIFIKKSLSFLIYEGISKKVADCIMFTTKTIHKNLVSATKQAAQAIGICEDNIYMQDHEESFVAYTIHQKSELWNFNVILLEYDKEHLKAFCLKINTKTTPITATMQKTDWKEIKEMKEMFPESNCEERKHKLDQLLKEKLKEYFLVGQVSCVFLSGEGFEGEWPKETLRFLCTGRRVFQGKNLFTKGACYFAAKKLIESEVASYLFLGANKVRYNIGLDVSFLGNKQYVSLVEAGENWYEAGKECELILDEESMVEIKATPMEQKDTRIIIVNLHDFPERPNKTVRISLQVKFESADVGIVTIKDLGFGELFASSGKVWNHKMIL